MRGFLTAVLGLIVLEVLVTSPYADRFGQLAEVPAGIARRVLDPTVAAIPDRRNHA